MKTKYTDKIQSFFYEDNYIECFEEWFMEQEMKDQRDILREFVSICNELLERSGAPVPEMPEFDTLLADVEDKISTIQLIDQLEDIEEQEREVEIQKREAKEVPSQEEIETRKAFIAKNRPELIMLILADVPGKEELINIARSVVLAEVEMNIYDPEPWKDIAEILGL